MSAFRWQALLVGLGAASLLASILLGAPRMLNSDSASVVMLGDELRRVGALVSPGWYYASDDLGLEGRAQLAMLATALFGPGLAAFTLTVLSCALACFACGWALARTLGATRLDAATVALALLMGPSLIHWDLMVGLGISLPIALMLGMMAAVVRFVHRGGAHGWLVLAMAAHFVMAVSSPKKALAYLFVPVACAAALPLALHLRRALLDETVRLRLVRLVLSLLLVQLAGTVVHAWLAASTLHVNTSYAAISPGLQHIADNVGVIAALFARFAGAWNSALGWASVAIASTVLLVVLAAPLLAASGRWREFSAGPPGFVHVCALSGIGLIAGYLLTNEQIKPHYGIYYGMLPLAFAFPVAACVMQGSSRLARAMRGALMASLLLGAINCAWLLLDFPGDYFGFGINQRATSAERAGLARWLEREGLRFGYGAYWDTAALMVLTGDRVQLMTVETRASGGRLLPKPWLTRQALYAHPRGPEPWFIVRSLRARTPLPQACLPADRYHRVSGYHVWIYRRPMDGCFVPPRHAGAALPRSGGKD